MIFEQILVGIMENYVYIIGDEDSKDAAVVDPAWNINKILEIASKYNLSIKKILLTHTHIDHTNGIKKIAKETGAAVYVHKEEADKIKNLGIEKIKTIDEGDEIKIGKIKVKVLHTPGHTPGSVCYLADSKLITGDTLFVEGIGRVDLPGGDKRTMSKSLKRLKNLDENIEVYPGHNYGSKPHSTIGHEKKNNPYMII